MAAALFGAVSSGLRPAIQAAKTAYRVGSAAKSAYDAQSDVGKLIDRAINEDDYLRYNTTEDYLKTLSKDVINVVDDIPVIGESMAILGKPVSMAIDGFISDVLAPIFLDTEAERKAIERRIQWEQDISQRSLLKYGYVMSPAEWQAAEFEQLKIKHAKNLKKRNEDMDKFIEKARGEGFSDVREYTKYAREQTKKELEDLARENGFDSLRAYNDSIIENRKKIREERQAQGRGVRPQAKLGLVPLKSAPMPTPTAYNPFRPQAMAPPVMPTPGAAQLNPFNPMNAWRSNSGIIPGITPINFSGIRQQ